MDVANDNERREYLKMEREGTYSAIAINNKLLAVEKSRGEFLRFRIYQKRRKNKENKKRWEMEGAQSNGSPRAAR